MNKELSIIYSIPDGFFESDAKNLYKIFSSPTIIHLEGEKKDPLFISTLLHGNEYSGLLALQNYLKSTKNLSRSIILFIGNIAAAKEGLRTLDSQNDFNRIWGEGNSWEHKIAQEVMNYAKKHKILASIDIHNNSGNSPHYACVNKLENQFFQLAKLFGKEMIYFEKPHEVQSIAFAKICPSTTIECGIPGDPDGIKRIQDFIQKLTLLESIPKSEVNKSEIKIYQTFARLFVPQSANISFELSSKTIEKIIKEENLDEAEEAILDSSKDFIFLQNIDHYNFKKIPKDFLIAYRNNEKLKLKVLNEKEVDISDQFLTYKENKVLLKQDVIGSMFTKDSRIVKQDCFGYFMEQILPS